MFVCLTGWCFPMIFHFFFFSLFITKWWLKYGNRETFRNDCAPHNEFSLFTEQTKYFCWENPWWILRIFTLSFAIKPIIAAAFFCFVLYCAEMFCSARLLRMKCELKRRKRKIRCKSCGWLEYIDYMYNVKRKSDFSIVKY